MIGSSIAANTRITTPQNKFQGRTDIATPGEAYNGSEFLTISMPLDGSSNAEHSPATRCYVAFSVSTVISLGANTRNGGPQKPVPRLV